MLPVASRSAGAAPEKHAAPREIAGCSAPFWLGSGRPEIAQRSPRDRPEIAQRSPRPRDCRATASRRYSAVAVEHGGDSTQVVVDVD